MDVYNRRLVASVFLAASLAAHSARAALDTLVLGDPASEAAHALFSANTERIAGALGEPARRALPLSPQDIYGGHLIFTLAVDPARRNYVTVKLWGGDDGDAAMGRLYLYVPIDGTDYQVGYRHEGDYMPLSVASSRPSLPGQFFYSTTLLPLSMTQGKASLTLKIVSTGRLYGLGQGGPPDGNYQFLMDRPSRGIYRAYTHVDPFLDPAGEVQGTAPASTIRPTPGEEVLTPGGTLHNSITAFINGRLSAAADTSFPLDDVTYLARAYSVPHLSVSYQNPAIVDQVTAVIDAYAAAYYDGTVSPGGWGGRFGPLGHAIHLLSGELADRFDVVVAYGAGGTKPRREAWGDLLYASREYGRLNRDGRALSNQNFISDGNIYKANKGLAALGDGRAFDEATAQRYLREACGLEPWLGSDLSAGGHSQKFGTQYYQVTTKGLTREWGYVGKGYGEMAFHAATFYTLTGNPVFRDQAARMGRARAPFRRPALDTSGGGYYRTMQAIGLLAWRGAHQSDGEFGNDLAYADSTEWSLGLRVAAETLDPTLVGYAKQMLADHQYFRALVSDGRYPRDVRALEVFGDYKTIAAAEDPGIRLPMTDGQPNFAWADEEDRILAVKHGADRLWIAPYWQAKTGTGINGIARFQFSTTAYTQYGVLETVPQFILGGSFVRPSDYIDKPEQFQWRPSDPPAQAYGGERLPLGVMPPDATDDPPFRGKADFYAFRFGHYLVGMNASTGNTYTLKAPAGFTSAPDLVSGAILSGPISVAPLSTVALFLSNATDPSQVPGAPLMVSAKGTDGAVTLSWTAASGATGYNVKRAGRFEGSFATIAAGISSTTYTDTTVAAGRSYVYRVSATNENGEGYDSMRALALPSGLPPPWSHADVGNVGTAGDAAYNAFTGSYLIEGAGADIGGSADSFHFAYLLLTGDGAVVVRLAAQGGNSSASKVGLVMRESLNANARSGAVLWDDAFNTPRFASRSSTGGNTSWTQPASSIGLPVWLKLERAGNTFTGSYSMDGETWILLGAAAASMGTTIFAGLAVCSRDTGTPHTATFDSVTAPGVLPAPTGLAAISGDYHVSLSWNTVTSAAAYSVKRATLSGGPYAAFATSSTNQAIDGKVVNGTMYYYVVSSRNGDAESPDSSQVTATPSAPIGADERAIEPGGLQDDGATLTLFAPVSRPGHQYWIEATASLDNPAWLLIVSPQSGTGAPLPFSMPIPLRPQQFYRMAIERQR